MQNNYLIIMAGGIGSRFYPFSRQAHPKQFQDILGTGKTLIRQTFERFAGVCPPENVFVVTNREYEELVTEQLPELDEEQVLLEPFMRNTAPCIAYAAYKIRLRDPKANLVVSPADHLVMNEQAFRQAIGTGLAVSAEYDAIVTVGIQPSSPNTGYGYIKQGSERLGATYAVERFTEKPDLETAQNFLNEGGYLWNAGIFICSAETVRRQFAQHLPTVHQAFDGLMGSYYTSKENARVEIAYESCPNVSIDYGVMEKARNVYVLPADFGWSDLGTWKSLYEASEKDKNGNAISGNVRVYGVRDSVVKAGEPGRIMVLSGLEGFIVAEYGGVLLVCPKEEEQRVKGFLNDLKAEGKSEYL